MSVTKVLKNVYTFAQILGQASGVEVSHWDKEALDNSFRWAAYCEQVHQHVKGKPFEADFEHQLQEMTLLLDPPICQSVDIELLSNASQVIQQVLLQNPHINMELMNSLVSRIQGDDPSDDALIQRISELASLHGAVKVSDEIVRNLSRNVDDMFKQDVWLMGDNSALMGDNSAYSQGVLLMNHLVKQLCTATKLERFTQYVEGLAEALVVQKAGWEILLCALCVESVEVSEQRQLDCQKTRDVIYQWMEKVSNKSDYQRKLLAVNCVLLCKVSLENTQFFSLYKNMLLHWGEMMAPEYSSQIYSTKLYGWRPTKSSAGSHSELVEHFVTLLSRNQNQTLRLSTAQFLTDLAEKSYFNIWRDIIKMTQRKQREKHCDKQT